MLISEIITPIKNSTSPVDLTNTTADNILKKECTVALNMPLQLFRGIPITDDFAFGDSSKLNRKSAYAGNYYTIIIDNFLPEWKTYPKRSKSFICSNDSAMAGSYGNTYKVYPVGDPIVGVCPKHDFQISFGPAIIWQLEPIFRLISLLLFKSDQYNDSYSNIERSIVESDKNWDILTNNINFNSAILQYLGVSSAKFDSFSELLAYVFSPSRNDFNCVKLSQLKKYVDRDDPREIWFSGPSYFVQW